METHWRETLLKASGPIPKENVGFILICAEFLSTAAGETKGVSKQGGARRTTVLAATEARNLGAT